MASSDAYRKFQDLIFQELDEKEHRAKQNAVEDLVRRAEARGFTIEDLLKMLASGSSVAQILSLVSSKK